LVVVQETAKEFTGGEAKSVLEEGQEDYNLFGIGSGDIFPLCRSPLEHGVTREKVLFHQREELALTYSGLSELFWVGGSHGVKEGNPKLGNRRGREK
jgi:hypothetical protein